MFGRYGSQDMDAVSAWPIGRLRRRLDSLSRLIGKENEKGAVPSPTGKTY